MEQLEILRQQIADDTARYLQQGRTIELIPIGFTMIDPVTGFQGKDRRSYLESQKRGANATKQAAKARRYASRCEARALKDGTSQRSRQDAPGTGQI